MLPTELVPAILYTLQKLMIMIFCK